MSVDQVMEFFMTFQVPITGTMVVCAFGAVVWWFARRIIVHSEKRREALEELVASHIKLCNEKAVTTVQLENRIDKVQIRVDELKSSMSERTSRIDKMDEKIDGVNEKLDKILLAGVIGRAATID